MFVHILLDDRKLMHGLSHKSHVCPYTRCGKCVFSLGVLRLAGGGRSALLTDCFLLTIVFCRLPLLRGIA